MWCLVNGKKANIAVGNFKTPVGGELEFVQNTCIFLLWRFSRARVRGGAMVRVKAKKCLAINRPGHYTVIVLRPSKEDPWPLFRKFQRQTRIFKGHKILHPQATDRSFRQLKNGFLRVSDSSWANPTLIWVTEMQLAESYQSHWPSNRNIK